MPWQSLIDQIYDIEIDEDAIVLSDEVDTRKRSKVDPVVHQILSYLNQRGYQMASFERLRKRIDGKLTDQKFEKIIEENKTIFRKATLKGKKVGLAKLVP